MNLAAIHDQIDRFNQYLRTQKHCEIDWLYDKQVKLADHKRLTIENIEQWLSLIFQSNQTQRYWKSESNRSAELMNAMIQFDADMVSTAFNDLFDENRDLEGRIDRFKFYMDEIIQRMRRNNRKFLESWHHQDNSIISFYLMMQYPTLYTYYTRTLHEKIVESFGAKPLEKAENPVRFQKMGKTIHQIMLKNEMLVDLHKTRFSSAVIPTSRLLAYELFLFI